MAKGPVGKFLVIYFEVTMSCDGAAYVNDELSEWL